VMQTQPGSALAPEQGVAARSRLRHGRPVRDDAALDIIPSAISPNAPRASPCRREIAHADVEGKGTERNGARSGRGDSLTSMTAILLPLRRAGSSRSCLRWNSMRLPAVPARKGSVQCSLTGAGCRVTSCVRTEHADDAVYRTVVSPTGDLAAGP
jgi:hypothetical protein